jgi:trimeric autotransporter adhesin
MAWFSSWTRAQQLVITVPSGTTSALPYFPVVLTAASLPTELTNNTYGRSDGGDLAFAADLGAGNSVSSIGAQLPCEVVSASFGGTPAAEIHVQVPSVAATGTLTYIWVLYGNSGQTAQPAAGSTYGSQAVWNENGTQNYQGVWHYGTPSTLSVADSTSNALTNTNYGVTAGTGELGGAATFVSASNTYLDFGNVCNIGLNSWTVNTWFKTNQTGTTVKGLICKSIYNSQANRWWVLLHDGSDNIEIAFCDSSTAAHEVIVAASSSVYEDGAWHLLTGIWNRAGLMSLYLDAVQVGTPITISAYSGQNWTTTDDLLFGAYNSGTGIGPYAASYYNGLLDETRIAATNRSASWIAAEYANQSAPGTFIAPPGGQGPISTVTSYTYSAAGLAISGGYGGTGATVFAPLGGLAISGGYGGAVFPGIIAPLGGLAISGYPGTSTAGPSPGVAGLAISGAPGGAVFPGIISSAAGLAISGYPGGVTAGPSPGVAGLAISGGYGGTGATVSVLLAGLGISGSLGGMTSCPPAYIFSAAGMAISGGPGGAAGTVTISAAGLGISGYPGGATGGQFLGPFYLPYEYTSVIIETGNANPFGIDPEKTTIITVGLTSAD